LIENKEHISEISFDYMLGHRHYDGSHCFKLFAQKTEEHKLKLPENIYIHSEYPNAETHFKSVSMWLSYTYDVDVDMIKIHENGTQTIIKAFE